MDISASESLLEKSLHRQDAGIRGISTINETETFFTTDVETISRFTVCFLCTYILVPPTLQGIL